MFYKRHGLITQYGFRNAVIGGEAGFTLVLRQPRQQNLWMASVQDITVTVDETVFGPEDISISVDRYNFCPVRELQSHEALIWEFPNFATVFVRCPGGLPAGVHTVQAALSFRMGGLEKATGSHVLTIV